MPPCGALAGLFATTCPAWMRWKKNSERGSSEALTAVRSALLRPPEVRKRWVVLETIQLAVDYLLDRALGGLWLLARTADGGPGSFTRRRSGLRDGNCGQGPARLDRERIKVIGSLVGTEGY